MYKYDQAANGPPELGRTAPERAAPAAAPQWGRCGGAAAAADAMSSPGPAKWVQCSVSVETARGRCNSGSANVGAELPLGPRASDQRPASLESVHPS
jgi:hypothetical protein